MAKCPIKRREIVNTPEESTLLEGGVWAVSTPPVEDNLTLEASYVIVIKFKTTRNICFLIVGISGQSIDSREDANTLPVRKK